MARLHTVTVLFSWMLALGDAHQAVPAQGLRRIESTPTDCVTFASPARLAAGTPFRASLPRGLEFRLSSDWRISVGPVDEPALDYMWLVSPPPRTAPHTIIGPGYGLTARESARLERSLRFVLSRADYDAARKAIDLNSAIETLKEVDRLGRGQVSLTIGDFAVRDVASTDGGRSDAFEWISFKGKACVPK